MPELYVRVNATLSDQYSEYTSEDDITLNGEILTLEQILEKIDTYRLKCYNLVRLNSVIDSNLNKDAIDALRERGWIHKDGVANRTDKKLFDEKYYLLDKNESPYSSDRFIELDLDNLTDRQLDKIAKGAEIIQKVQVKSILPDSSYKKLQTKKKQLADIAVKTAENKKKKEAVEKQKKIEEAKKLLKEAGEDV